MKGDSRRVPHADNAKENRKSAADFRGLEPLLAITARF